MRLLPRPLPRARNRAWRVATALLGAFCLSSAIVAHGDPVVLYLKNGDRIAGFVITESTNSVTLSNTWASSLLIPLEAVARRDDLPMPSTNAAPSVAVIPTNAPATAPATATNPPAPVTIAAGKPPQQKAKEPKKWSLEFNLGTSSIFGTTESQNFAGSAKLTYAVPYRETPQRYFRSIVNLAGTYGTANGVVNADQLAGSLKNDFDVGPDFYIYNLGGAGFDTVRLIDLQWEVGPGGGWHAVKKQKFVLDFEFGGQYLSRNLSSGNDTRNVFLRFADSITWQIAQRVTLKQNFAYLPQSTDFADYRLRFEGTLSFALINNLSLNLVAVNLYDSSPARTVEPNQLQLRSMVGINF